MGHGPAVSSGHGMVGRASLRRGAAVSPRLVEVRRGEAGRVPAVRSRLVLSGHVRPGLGKAGWRWCPPWAPSPLAGRGVAWSGAASSGKAWRSWHGVCGLGAPRRGPVGRGGPGRPGQGMDRSGRPGRGGHVPSWSAQVRRVRASRGSYGGACPVVASGRAQARRGGPGGLCHGAVRRGMAWRGRDGMSS